MYVGWGVGGGGGGGGKLLWVCFVCVFFFFFFFLGGGGALDVYLFDLIFFRFVFCLFVVVVVSPHEVGHTRVVCL